MTKDFLRDPMMEIFIFDTNQLLEELENSILNSEKTNDFKSSINQIFRIMHSIKGSSSMMLLNNIAILSHSIEDLFDYIRSENLNNLDVPSLTDLVLKGIDFIKSEISKLQNNERADGDSNELVEVVKQYLNNLKSSNISLTTDIERENVRLDENQKYYISSVKTNEHEVESKYKAVIQFESGCQMENIRAFTLLNDIKQKLNVVSFSPEKLIDNPSAVEEITSKGFEIIFTTSNSIDEINKFLSGQIFVREVEIDIVKNEVIRELINESSNESRQNIEQKSTTQESEHASSQNKQNMINVNILKLDKLMDMVGELVIAEAMVTQNPDLVGLNLESFNKSSRQLKKITDEIQDIVMSIRMVPLAMTFQKMNRLVRDMSRKLNKEVDLEIIGEQTEVDKSIIESISDPLMHLIRNAMDHGIETPDERIEKGKPERGKITLEAKNSGGDVWIIVKDDGKGLNKEKILSKAKEKGLLQKPEEELTDKEIYSMVFLPGFSTKDAVSEFSGRGVGMDVVIKNIEKVRGTVSVDSIPNAGSIISIKIPLTLAIIDGMNIKVGSSRYTIPITSIKESFRIKEDSVIRDPDGNEMVMVRGQCYKIIRLHEIYNVKNAVANVNEGIIIMVEDEDKVMCLFADELIGEQQVVVKALPKYINEVRGVAGCTLLGDGSISLIFDVSALVNI